MHKVLRKQRGKYMMTESFLHNNQRLIRFADAKSDSLTAVLDPTAVVDLDVRY